MTKEEYEDFVLRYKGCGACFPMYHTLSRFEKMWFTAIQKDVAELENKIADIKANCDLAIEGRDVKIMELEAELEQAKKVKVVEHFEAFGQCRDSRRIAELEQQIEKMKRYLDCEYCEHYTQPYGCKNCNEETRSDWKLKEIKENEL